MAKPLKYKKGDIVTWGPKVSNIVKRYVGEIISVIKPNQPVEKFLNKLNKKITKTSVIEMDIQFQEKIKKQKGRKNRLTKNTSTTRPEESYIVAIKNREGRDVLYWPRNRKLSLAEATKNPASDKRE